MYYYYYYVYIYFVHSHHETAYAFWEEDCEKKLVTPWPLKYSTEGGREVGVCIKSLFFQKKGSDLLKISKNGSKSNKSSVFCAYFIFL